MKNRIHSGITLFGAMASLCHFKFYHRPLSTIIQNAANKT